MRCDQCEHWKRDPEDWEAESVGFRLCTAVRPRWRIEDEAAAAVRQSGSAEDDWRRANREALQSARAYVQDGSEYRAELLTGPDFFCALFKQK